MELVSILVNLQINVCQTDTKNDGLDYCMQRQKIYHHGKEIAEQHGLKRSADIYQG